VARHLADVLDERLDVPRAHLVEVVELVALLALGRAADDQRVAELGQRRLVLLGHIEVQQRPAGRELDRRGEVRGAL
jgi:hypothetical protein